MERDLISRLAHADHPIAAPLGDAAVTALLNRALPRGDEHILDLGCGGGEWLLRALALAPDATAEGVDVSEAALDHARREAAQRGLADRLTLHEQDAAAFTPDQPPDLVLCVGSTHVFGGLLPALAAARKVLAPGGRVLVGDGYWERDPSPAAVEILGDLADLPTTVDTVTADGWVPVYGHISTRHELDDYEWNWTGSLAERAPGQLATATEHRNEWLRVYRDCFGFLTLVLTPAG
ncbi:SAM-dependent methyltransferase [Amycolatopsis deserti]|uniref:SAM-dependent methyltransferase n=1 Tax=Amycolatopsis deserti TaxID=185696 RepID=UPI00174D2450|nr:class I SAM-dependent methyltransferase [Amycolatopsis deserti]